MLNGKKEFNKEAEVRTENVKLNKICEIWKEGKGICIMQLYPETCHHEALSIEFSIIKALGVENISNEINGTCYGAMKRWGENEVLNYGNICLLKALKLAIQDMP